MHLLWLIPLGWLAGSAVNYFADVLPAHRRLVQPFCAKCQVAVAWTHLIWPGGCPHCHAAKGLRYWLVQIGGLAVIGYLWYFPNPKLGFVLGLVWCLYFGVLAVIDMEHHLILHPTSWFGAAIGLATGFGLHGLWPTLLGGAVGYGIMLGLYMTGKLFMRLVSRRSTVDAQGVALGYGDVNLSGVIGLLLGWPAVIGGLVIGLLLSGMVSFIVLAVSVILRRYRAFQHSLPLGPFLISGALILFFW
ncbi:MAG: A24 family peptidase [Chloroflexota bacterium]